jgi:short-subunit dehydrogenase
VYYASKAYLLSLSEAIASELAGEGVRITAVAPGPVNTRFHERMGAEQSLYRYLMVPSSPEAVARAAYYGFALGLRVVIPGPFNPILALALRLLPHRILTPLIGVLLKQRGTSASNARGHSSR